jgi:phosphate transport system protein
MVHGSRVWSGKKREGSAVPDGLRRAFHQDLQRIDDGIRHLFGDVRHGLAQAPESLVLDDKVVGQELVVKDRKIDDLADKTERLVRRQLELQSPRSSDLRFLLTAMRIIPQLERSADLVGHIARFAGHGTLAGLSQPCRELVADMGEISQRMWTASELAYVERDPLAADRLNVTDDELDVVCRAITDEVAGSDLPVPVAMDIALLARFFERLGDHAVHLAHRLRYMVGIET